eukprot:TRINITY_DN1731_c1_g1_i1.p1 TRINITY_DN1731_c1_g1~~TRINITY_DN1731_c1_g1_i1.p1  ORF type:complete len:347 (+),score=115.03 TRINITY_DN1731_c1_g1_i1:94-1041(+)
MVKVAVLGGAGQIGQALALLLKMQLPRGSSLNLYDIVNTPGVAADLSHINTGVKVEGFKGDAQLEAALTGVEVVVIPAGMPRKPGMTRDDLFKVNAGIVKTLITGVAKTCPKALVAIITNPVNSTVPVAAGVLKAAGVYDPRRVFGVTTLDVVRTQAFIGELKGVDPQTVQAHVVGGHSPETMLPLLSQVSGVSFTQPEIEDLTKRIQDAGTFVVNAKEGAGSATLSMAFAGARFTMALVRALGGETGIVEDTYIQVDNQETEFLSVPVELGPNGVQKVLPIGSLSSYEESVLKTAIPVLKQNIETGHTFLKASL